MPDVFLVLTAATRDLIYYAAAALLVGLVLLGISRLSKVRTASSGNIIGSVSMLAMIALTLWYFEILAFAELWIAMLLGSVIGIWLMRTVRMIQMPQMVGMLNGFGGAASMLAGTLTLIRPPGESVFSIVTAGLAIAVGSLTFTGSAVAAGKLHGLIPGRSVRLKGHPVLVLVTLAASLSLIVVLAVINISEPVKYLLILLLAIVSGAFGVLFSMRVGGADMPVTISLLNSFSGVAGSIAGMAVSDPLLVAVGGIVGASGLLLTRIMCKAMNRSLTDILLGFSAPPKNKKPLEATAVMPADAESNTKETEPADPYAVAAEKLRNARHVMLIPGYGMALAQAQRHVNRLRQTLEAAGTGTAFGIHPVAGRMPGHMNVLLAEADVPYDIMLDLDQANERMGETDVVVIVGANDVINPAAQTAKGTPIYGMPVLEIGRAGHAVFCNFDDKPGYAGVDNPLYRATANVSLLFGDAAATLDRLLDVMQTSDKRSETVVPLESDPFDLAATKIGAAKQAVIIPGYGMALAQAQHLVRRLSESMQKQGTEVSFGIHPVAGRMPGHMNVLLAEADVPYDLMLDMDTVNDRFRETDVVVVVGANDVVNPAAQTAEDTPIYGMPVLQVADAAHVIFCNMDDKPGYAGVDNPLYHDRTGKVSLLFGDAAQTLEILLNRLSLMQSEL